MAIRLLSFTFLSTTNEYWKYVACCPKKIINKRNDMLIVQKPSWHTEHVCKTKLDQMFGWLFLFKQLATLGMLFCRWTYLWSRWAIISPPGNPNLVASKAALIDSLQVPPMLAAPFPVFDWFASSIGREYPESRWPTQTPSFLWLKNARDN